MKCSKCGGDLPDGSAFCPQCGAQSAGAAAVAQAAPSSGGPLRGKRASSGTPPEERELWSGSYSPKAMIGWFIGAGLLTVVGAIIAMFTDRNGWLAFGVGAVVVWAGVALVALYRRYTVNYRLTSFRLFHETGLLSRTRDRIEVIDIDDVTLTQGLVERMFNVGTIRVLASDQSLSDREGTKNGLGTLEMLGIDDPRAVADLIDNTRRSERERRAIFMENV